MLQETKAQGNEQDQDGRAEKLYTQYIMYNFSAL